MSLPYEKLRAQKMACDHKSTQPWHRHLVGPTELETLFIGDAENRQRGLTLSTLCDMVLGEDAADRSDEALIRGVRRMLIALSEGNKISKDRTDI